MRFSRLQRFSWLLMTLLISHLINPYVEAKEPNLPALQVEVSSFEKLLVIGRGTANTASWKHDGTQLAVGGSRGLWIYQDNFQTAQFIQNHPKALELVAWNPQNTQIASVVDNHVFDTQQIIVWDIASDSLVASLAGHRGHINTLAWSPDGTYLASGADDNDVRIWQSVDWTAHLLSGHTDSIEALAWNSDGSQLVSGSLDQSLRIWDISTLSLAYKISHDEKVLALAWNHAGNQLAASGLSAKVVVWDTNSGQLLDQLDSFASNIEQLAWSFDDSRLLVAGSHIFMWNMLTSTLDYMLEGHLDNIKIALWQPNNYSFISLSGGDFSKDNTVRLWDGQTGQILSVLLEHSSPINTLAWYPDGSKIGAMAIDGWARTWHINGQLETSMPINRGLAVWNADWTRLAGEISDPSGIEIVAWQAVATPSGGIIEENPTPPPVLVQRLEAHGGRLAGIAWAHNKQQIASISAENNELRISNTTTWALERRLSHSSLYLSYTLSWSPDDTKVALAGLDSNLAGIIQIWEVATGSLLTTLHGHTDEVTLLSWSPDSTMLASGSWGEGSVYLWKLTDQTPILLASYGNSLISLAWYPQQAVLAIGSADKVYLWDTELLVPLTILETGQASADVLAWSPDGTMLASASYDGSIHIWGNRK